MRKHFIAFCMLCIVLISNSPSVQAASYELSVTMKKALDQLSTNADTEQGKKLNAAYQLIISLQNQEHGLDSNTKRLHLDHQTAEKSLRQRIQKIDETKIKQLSENVQQTKVRYQPLYDSYTLLNKQIERARKIKNNPLTPILRAQAKQMKLLVQIAREDVRTKEKALTSVKDAAAIQMKTIRERLNAIDPIETKIKTKRTSISALHKITSSYRNSVNQAIKVKEIQKVQTSLQHYSNHIHQIIRLKQDILQLEKDIMHIINKAASLLPSS